MARTSSPRRRSGDCNSGGSATDALVLRNGPRLLCVASVVCKRSLRAVFTLRFQKHWRGHFARRAFAREKAGRCASKQVATRSPQGASASAPDNSEHKGSVAEDATGDHKSQLEPKRCGEDLEMRVDVFSDDIGGPAADGLRRIKKSLAASSPKNVKGSDAAAPTCLDRAPQNLTLTDNWNRRTEAAALCIQRHWSGFKHRRGREELRAQVVFLQRAIRRWLQAKKSHAKNQNLVSGCGDSWMAV